MLRLVKARCSASLDRKDFRVLASDDWLAELPLHGRLMDQQPSIRPRMERA
jgi:hypothetical protein